jgi:hypothetical protein
MKNIMLLALVAALSACGAPAEEPTNSGGSRPADNIRPEQN